jgi:hypothetical protein
MSNEVYGYFEVVENLEIASILAGIQEKTGLGITQISFDELYNFPKEIISANENRCVAFIIGDGPGNTNTTYLTDYMDYAPEAEIDLPLNGKERLVLLVNLFITMIHEFSPSRFVVGITVCNQIEEIKTLKFEDLGKVIYEDFEQGESPDCIYDVVFK